MTVARQGFRDAPFAHEEKGNTVRQRPFLVVVQGMKFERGIELIARKRNDFPDRRFAQLANQWGDLLARLGFRQGIYNFGQDSVGCEEACFQSSSFLHRFCMVLVMKIEQCNKIKSVRKNGLHALGWP